MQGYVNLKCYGEFDHDKRPDGSNVWLTFVLSLRHRRAVDPEAADGDAMDRRLFGIMLVGSPAERPGKGHQKISDCRAPRARGG